MKKIIILVGILAVVCKVGSLQAQNPAFITNIFSLSTNQETMPPNVPMGLFAPTGQGIIVLSGTGYTNLDITITFSNLTGNPQAAHLHGPALPGANAGVKIDLSAFGALPMDTNGTITGSTNISPNDAAEILGGLWYANIHTLANGAGEIRGQIPPTPVLKLSSANYSVSETNGSLTVTVTRTGLVTNDVSVNYTATTNGIGTNFATFADFTNVTGTLIFTNGVTNLTFQVPIVDDGTNVIDGNEQFVVFLDSPTNGILGSPSSAIVTIIDPAVPPSPFPASTTVLAFKGGIVSAYPPTLVNAGAAVRQSAKLKKVGAVRAGGNFNGDANTDFITQKGTAATIFTAMGNTFSNAPALTLPAKHKILGSADIDGDGVAELITKEKKTLRVHQLPSLAVVATVNNFTYPNVAGGYTNTLIAFKGKRAVLVAGLLTSTNGVTFDPGAPAPLKGFVILGSINGNLLTKQKKNIVTLNGITPMVIATNGVAAKLGKVVGPK